MSLSVEVCIVLFRSYHDFPLLFFPSIIRRSKPGPGSGFVLYITAGCFNGGHRG